MSGGPIPGRERTRIWRVRRAAGEVVVSVRVTADDLAMMIRRGVLTTAAAQDRRAVALAVERLLDDTARRR